MTFIELTDYLHHLDQTSSRLEMTAQLAELWKHLTPAEIPIVCYLLQGQLVPTYQSLEFNFSVNLMQRAIAVAWWQEPATAAYLATKLTDQQITQPTNQPHLDLFSMATASNDLEKKSVPNLATAQNYVQHFYSQVGDLGEVIFQLLTAVRSADWVAPQQLTILEVFSKLKIIAECQGTGSQEKKINLTAQLLAQLPAVAAQFVGRMILGKMRLGLSTMTIIDSLSWRVIGNKDYSLVIEEAFNRKADIGLLAAQFLAAPDEKHRQQVLASYDLAIGIPLVAALCQRLNSAAEIIDKMGTVIAEPKYDGLRAQIHFDQQTGLAKVFTRNMEDVTAMFPEVGAGLAKLNCQSAIFDAEAIGYDPTTHQLVDFQLTMTRKRKYEVANQALQVPIKFFVFDVLAVDGQSLLTTPLQDRKQILARVLPALPNWAATAYLVTADPTELHQFHDAQLQAGLEGAVIKKIDSVYFGGRKGWRWVKIKETEGKQGKLADTLDCVLMGYYPGRGKRAGFGVGAFLVGVVENDQVKTIAKIGTGLSDELIVSLKQLADAHAVNQPPANYEVATNLIPAVWVEPAIVLEIAADELTRSPIHSAGLALRFPRLIKIRTDKDWTQATKIDELKNF